MILLWIIVVSFVQYQLHQQPTADDARRVIGRITVFVQTSGATGLIYLLVSFDSRNSQEIIHLRTSIFSVQYFQTVADRFFTILSYAHGIRYRIASFYARSANRGPIHDGKTIQVFLPTDKSNQVF